VVLQMLAALASRLRGEKGQGMVEYGLIIALVAVVVIGVLTAMGSQVSSMFCKVVTALSGSCTSGS
jgi:pilus assembly protein Flp/PilA